MPSKDYWQKRFEELQDALLQNGESLYVKVEKQYRKALKDMDRELAAWYAKFAKDNQVTNAEARRVLSNREFSELRWTLDEYLKVAKANDLSPEWQRKLKNASIRSHITRLEALMLQLQQHLELLFSNQLDSLDKAMTDTYTEGFKRTAYEVQKGVGYGSSFDMPDTRKIEQVIAAPWAKDGKNFSARVWEHRDKLVNALRQEMSQAVIRGDDYRKATSNLASRMNVSKHVAGRLIMTESAFFASRSQHDCFKELGVGQYRFVATLDKRTSEACREHDGRVYNIDEFKAGVTAPPLHCYCRSCTAPYFADEKGERVARGDDGKTYKVPSSMTYQAWEKKFSKSLEIPKDVLSRSDIDKEYRPHQNKGTVSIPNDLKISRHQEEISTAKMLVETIGGNLTLLTESKRYNEKTPDYLWGGRFWDLKTITTTKAIDSAGRKGLKQISDKPGGVIFRYTDNSLDLQEMVQFLEERLFRSLKGEVNIIIISDTELVFAQKYSKH